MMSLNWMALAALLLAPARAQLVPADKPLEAGAGTRVYVFKKTPQGDLKVNVYLPAGWRPEQKRPAMVMFFGGGFVSGSPEQFRSKAEYLAGRGMVAFTPEYRVKNRHNTTPDKSVEDARSAIRWVRMNAAALGVDPARIVASGGSAGGTAAALSGLTAAFEPDGENMAVSSRPDVLVLYNPALTEPGAPAQLGTAMLGKWQVTKGSPPMLFFFGTEDKWLAGSRAVAAQAAKVGVRAELYTAPGQKHGFFNDARTAKNGSPGWHDVVLYRTDVFLTSLGYLSGKPTVKPDPALSLSRDRGLVK